VVRRLVSVRLPGLLLSQWRIGTAVPESFGARPWLCRQIVANLKSTAGFGMLVGSRRAIPGIRPRE